jgi:hypothetical protein
MGAPPLRMTMGAPPLRMTAGRAALDTADLNLKLMALDYN